jgi:hypothetical protein
MRRQLILHRADAPAERVTLTGRVVLGGPPEALRLGGMPPALLFSPSASGAVVEARVPRTHAAGRPLEPGKRRLLRPGERAEYMGTAVELEPEPPAEGTRVLAGLLLRQAVREAAPIAEAHLVVLEGPTAGLRIPLGPSQTIGRGRAAAIRLPDAEASRIHARVCAAARAILVEDLGSKNGIRLNGERMRSRRFPLQPGDEIAIGSTTLVLAAPPGLCAGATSQGHSAASPGATAPRTVTGERLSLARWVARAKPTALALASVAALLAAAIGLSIAAARN